MKTSPEFIESFLGYFEDPDVDEVCWNGTRSICVYKKNKAQVFVSPYKKIPQMTRECQEFALSQGLRLDAFCPSAGGHIHNENFRWHCLIPPASLEGPLLTIRRHRFENLQIEDFKISDENAKCLKVVFENPKNHIIFCGPTGSGKTTLLSSFLKTYAQEQRVIIIEECHELPLISPQWTRMLSRQEDVEGRGSIKLSFLIESSLRLRPDRLVLGELRTLDSLVFFESLLFGHYGSLSTLHASDLKGVEKRLNALQAMRGTSQKDFFSNFEGLRNLWYVFMERGSPPSVVGIEVHR